MKDEKNGAYVVLPIGDGAKQGQAESISEIVNNLRRIFKAMHAYSKEVLKEFGVTGPQLWALRILHDGGSLHLGQLAGKMHVHVSTACDVVDRLEAKTLVSRSRSLEDHREVGIKLTPKGERMVGKAPLPAQGKLLHGLERLSRMEIHKIQEAMKTLVEIMEVQDLEARFFFSEE
jgi:DNA-binding MarR family transcriptional regulator